MISSEGGHSYCLSQLNGFKQAARERVRRATFVAALALATPCAAQQVGSDDFTYESGILVTADDVTTCPYRVVQPVTASVTEDYGADTRSKIFGKLRALAIKAGADAVLLVTKGKTHMTAWAWNRREYTGRAVRYIDRACAPTGL